VSRVFGFRGVNASWPRSWRHQDNRDVTRTIVTSPVRLGHSATATGFVPTGLSRLVQGPRQVAPPCRDVLRTVAVSYRAVFAVNASVFPLLEANGNGEPSQTFMMTIVRVAPHG
jgi:hypothetical protein